MDLTRRLEILKAAGVEPPCPTCECIVELAVSLAPRQLELLEGIGYARIMTQMFGAPMQTDDQQNTAPSQEGSEDLVIMVVGDSFDGFGRRDQFHFGSFLAGHGQVDHRPSGMPENPRPFGLRRTPPSGK